MNTTERKNQQRLWSPEEREKIETRILALRDDQVAALANLVGLNFSLSDIEGVVRDIREHGRASGHLPIVIDEADSKDKLLWWVGYFERTS